MGDPRDDPREKLEAAAKRLDRQITELDSPLDIASRQLAARAIRALLKEHPRRKAPDRCGTCGGTGYCPVLSEIVRER